VKVKFLAEASEFSLLQNIQTVCGAYTASYSRVPGVKSSGTPSSARVKNKHSYANMPSWHAQIQLYFTFYQVSMCYVCFMLWRYVQITQLPRIRIRPP